MVHLRELLLLGLKAMKHLMVLVLLVVVLLVVVMVVVMVVVRLVLRRCHVWVGLLTQVRAENRSALIWS